MHITSPFPPTTAEVNAAGDVRCLVLVRRRTVSVLIKAFYSKISFYEKFMITTWEDEFNPRIFLHLVGSYCKVA